MVLFFVKSKNMFVFMDPNIPTDMCTLQRIKY